MNDFDDFLKWEKSSRDTIDFKKIYVDMAGDLAAGLMLSQIVYWYLPDKDGNTKLRVEKDGKLWLAKSDKDWWEEIRLTPNAARRALGILEKRKLVSISIHRFNGAPTTHICIDADSFSVIWKESLDAKREDVMRMVRENRGFTTENAQKMREALEKKRNAINQAPDLQQCDKSETQQCDKSETQQCDKCLTKITQGLLSETTFCAPPSTEPPQASKSAPPPKQSPNYRPIFGWIQTTTQMNAPSRIGKIAKAIDASGADLAVCERFEKYWWACDWRGQKQQRPTPEQIWESWPRALEWDGKAPVPIGVNRRNERDEPAGFKAIREAMNDPRYQE